MYVARELTRRSDPPDANETLGLGWLTAAEARALILDNAIPDGLTLTSLAWALLAGALAAGDSVADE